MKTRCNVSALFVLAAWFTVGGAVWEEIPSDLTTVAGTTATCFQLLFSSADTAWAFCAVSADAPCVYRSVNGGKNWTLLRNGITDPGYYINPRSISFADSRNGWILDEDSLLHTVDGGSTWSALPMTVADARIIIFKSAQWGCTFTDTAFYATTDGGTTWVEHPVNAGFSIQIFDLFFTDTLNGWMVTQGGIETGKTFRTVDGGVTWTGINGLGLFRSIWVTDDMHFVLAGNNGGFAGTLELKITFTGGVTWKSYQPSSGMRSVAFFTHDYGVAASYNDSLFIETADGGITWNPMQGISGSGSMSISVNGDHMYLLTLEGKIYTCALSTANHYGMPRGATGRGEVPVTSCSVGRTAAHGGGVTERRFLLSGRRIEGKAADGVTVRLRR